MYRSRPLVSASKESHNTKPMMQIAASYADVPVKDEQWSERWCTVPKQFATIMEKLIKFEVRDEDVFIITFMKCGTTWMQEIAWLLLHNLDFEGAKSDLLGRSPFLDFNGLLEIDNDTIALANSMASPRLLKSHMPAHLLPQQLWEKKPKIIYVARNIKDAVVSSFHFMKGLGLWQGTMDDYVTDFMNNEILYAPFWAMVVDFWKLRNEPYVFFTTYEEMKRDMPNVLQRLAKFLGKPALDAEQLQKVQTHVSFDQMKANHHTNLTKVLQVFEITSKDFNFMRRGIVGSYKDELSAEHCKRLDDWSSELLGKHGLKEEDIFGKL